MVKVLVTGVAGSGKSTVCRALLEMGVPAVDIEEIPDMFTMKVKGSSEEFVDYEAGSVEMIQRAEWVCNVELLQELLRNQVEEVGIYFGVASNFEEIVHLFDKVYLLFVEPDLLYKRLLSRDGDNDIGGTEESRQYVLRQKQWWEDSMRLLGAKEILADSNPEHVARQILALLKIKAPLPGEW